MAEMYEKAAGTNKAFVIATIANFLQAADYRKAASALLQKLKETARPDDLNAWAEDRIRRAAGRPNDSGLAEGGVPIPFGEIPETLRTLAPTNIFLAAAVVSQPGPEHVVVAWGTPMGGRYGVIIGPPRFSPPRGTIYTTNWQDGTFVWYDER